MGRTVTTTDQDGRAISAQPFDGSGLPAPWGSNASNWGAVSTSYNANARTVTDEAGKQRTTLLDGLGRMQ
jgi:hypothetical protein